LVDMNDEQSGDNTFKPYSFKFKCAYCNRENTIDGLFNLSAINGATISSYGICSYCRKMNNLFFEISEQNETFNLDYLEVSESDIDYDEDFGGWLKEPDLRVIDYLFDSLNETKYIAKKSKVNYFTETILKMSFSHAVTAMETYLCDTLIHQISTDESAFLRAIKFVDDITQRRFSLIEIHMNKDLVINTVRQTLKGFLYHNMKKVARLYRQVLNIEIPVSDDFQKYLALRHDIVHRNGKTVEGKCVEITDEIVESLISEIKNLAEFIDERI